MTQHQFFNYLIKEGYHLSNCPDDTTFQFTKNTSVVILKGTTIESKPEPGTSRLCALSAVSFKGGKLVYPKTRDEELL